MKFSKLPPEQERGVILINVLLFVAIASAVVLLMITAEESALHRSGRLADAAHARAIALGGELSAIVALRRDAIVAPDTDNSSEQWAKIAQKDFSIRNGRFELKVADAEDRFNINLLMKNDSKSIALVERIGAVLGVSPEAQQQMIDYVRIAGPISNLKLLQAAKFPPEALKRVSGMLTALPEDSLINLNSVGEDLLGLMIGDPVAARELIGIREKKGLLTPEDLLNAHVSQPPLSSFQSHLFWVRSRVRIGDTDQQLTSLLSRRRDGKNVLVAPIARWWGDPPTQSSIPQD